VSLSPVIADTLKVTPVPVPGVVPEGSDITLSCTVTRSLLQPTFLSVGWSLRRGSSPAEEVVTLGPDGAVSAGPGYSRRYADGGLRLQPGKDGLFVLVVTKVTVAADQGAYVCTGRQWTSEEGRAHAIVERSHEMGHVTVTPTGQTHTRGSHAHAWLTRTRMERTRMAHAHATHTHSTCVWVYMRTVFSRTVQLD